MAEFFQDGPVLQNQFTSDRLLRSYLKRRLPPETFLTIEPELAHLGELACGPMLALADEAERNPPKLVSYDPWGRRIDDIEVTPAWRELDRIAAVEGIVATGYERRFAELSRVVQFAKLYLYAPSSAIYSCPLAMTDGAARALELYGDEQLKSRAFKNLTTRDPKSFWTSGQWMTERTGGSDVSGTSTVARFEGGQWRLYGTKWFTSATTSQMAMALARIEGAPEGSAGLSLFYIELRDAKGALQNIRVHRLKDKLGTKALATAELTLEGTPAKLVGGEGQGVKKIASLFNITRMYNATCAVGFMRRALALATDYATRRSAFGKPLADHSLHVETLARLRLEFEAAFLMTFRLIELLGKEELGKASPQESATLRLLTPIAKLYTAKQAIAVVSEALECFGGAGYVEDTGLPRLLRDTQVLSIWEGTTNVLSLDALRAIEKEQAFEPLLADIEARIAAINEPELAGAKKQVRNALARIKTFAAEAAADSEGLRAGARQLSFTLARTYCASLLIEHAAWSLKHEHDHRGVVSANRWASNDLASLEICDIVHRADSKSLVFEL